MINKTMGVGGDYADVGSTINAILALGSLSDTYVFKAISDISNTTDVAVGHLVPNENDLIFNFDGYSVVSTKKILFNSFSTGYKGLIQIKNGKIFAEGLVGALIEINGIGGASADDQLWDLNNLLISNRGTEESSVEYAVQINSHNASLYCKLMNLRIDVRHLALTGAGFGLYFNGTGSGTDIKRRVENCSVYGSTKCTGINDNSLGRIGYKNVVSINEPSTALNWAIGSAGNLFDNCADRDGSLVGGTDTVSGITASSFTSVDYANESFLKIPIGSNLRDVGTITISDWNNEDFEGHPRPNKRGLCSIGAHEPISADATLRAKINGDYYQVTKRIDL